MVLDIPDGSGGAVQLAHGQAVKPVKFAQGLVQFPVGVLFRQLVILTNAGLEIMGDPGDVGDPVVTVSVTVTVTTLTESCELMDGMLSVAATVVPVGPYVLAAPLSSTVDSDIEVLVVVTVSVSVGFAGLTPEVSVIVAGKVVVDAFHEGSVDPRVVGTGVGESGSASTLEVVAALKAVVDIVDSG